MFWSYLLLLTLLTAAGGLLPLLRPFRVSWMTLLLAFSGSFLLGITFLHLLPESIQSLGELSGLYILAGYFLQLILQRLSHGVEHGHVHDSAHGTHAVGALLAGLSLHAFMEGIPLGFNYHHTGAMPSLFLGVAAHKLPEAITLTTLLLAGRTRSRVMIYVAVFALMSPLSAALAMYYGQQYAFVSHALNVAIPVVIGSFLHIATTVLYESGTRHHQLSRQKIAAILLGIALAAMTLLWE